MNDTCMSDGTKEKEEACHGRNPLVGVIVPTHNRPGLLWEACKSVYDQTYENVELVVVANYDENDESRRQLERIKQQPRTRVVVFPRRREDFRTIHGFESAIRNFGARVIEHAKYLCFLDDDDMFYPNRIQELTRAMEDRDLDWVSCDMLRVSIISTQLHHLRYFDGRKWPRSNIFVGTCSVQISAKFFEIVQWNESTTQSGEDRDYWRRARKAGFSITHIPIIGGECRCRELLARISKVRKKRLYIHWNNSLKQGFMNLNIRRLFETEGKNSLRFQPCWIDEIIIDKVINRVSEVDARSLLSACRTTLKKTGRLRLFANVCEFGDLVGLLDQVGFERSHKTEHSLNVYARIERLQSCTCFS